MNELVDLVRTELEETADAAPAPGGLADRALAGVRQRRIRRALTVGTAGLAAAALVGAVPLLLPHRTPQEAAAGAGQRSVVYATGASFGPWQVLNPETGRYRALDVRAVSLPTADLRYTAVTPREIPSPRIGRYESATGSIRWYGLPEPIVSGASISPDGRYAAGFSAQPRPALEVLDLGTGKVTVSPFPSVPGFGVGNATLFLWHADSRHLFMDNAVVDLGGRVTATLPATAGALVAVRPDAAAAVLTAPFSVPIAERWNTFQLTDDRGTVTGRATVSPGCRMVHADVPGPHGSPSPMPQSCMFHFLGWRGPHTVLVRDDRGPATFVLDLHAGAARRVYPPIADETHEFFLVAPVVHRSDVVDSATF